MATATANPAELTLAISNASQKYGVPPDLLGGIWQREAGGKFPNPYVNPSGYGGLFGTRNWNASTQAQADEAASILATGLQKSGGNVAEALSYYNSGKLVGGYTSVPGEVTFGNIAPNQKWLQGPPTGGGIAGTGVSISDVTGVTAISNLLSGGAPGSPEAATFKTIDSVPKLIEFVTSWRFVEVVGGFLLLLVGLILLGRQFGLNVATPYGGLSAKASSSSPAPSRSPAPAAPDELRAARVRTEGERLKEVRSRRRRNLEQSRETRAAREAREQRAYYRGAADAS